MGMYNIGTLLVWVQYGHTKCSHTIHACTVQVALPATVQVAVLYSASGFTCHDCTVYVALHVKIVQ
jgi:hypothetical protein